MESLPKFVTFGISHYCEKARWALDWHGISYDEECWPPGPHIFLAKRAGAKRSSLPILFTADRTIQGSGNIIDWADSTADEASDKLALPGGDEIEKRADGALGIHLRRLVYSQCLPEHPYVVKPALFHETAGLPGIIGKMMWPLTRRLMIKGFKIDDKSSAESRRQVEAELDWLDGLLLDNRDFLAGARFSRADISVASLLSPIVRPTQLPLYSQMELPSPLEADFQRWNERPIIQWAKNLYRSHRDAKRTKV